MSLRRIKVHEDDFFERRDLERRRGCGRVEIDLVGVCDGIQVSDVSVNL